MSVARDPAAAAIKLFGKTIALTNQDNMIISAEKEEERAGDDKGKETPCKKKASAAAAAVAVAKLPCPRCKSRVTKFCYYNNYNVNQPRHFCKNCQRYWTAGGTMRNVPVGSGRRKNKTSSSSNFLRRIMFSDIHHHQPAHAAPYAASPFYGALFGRPCWLSAPISPAALEKNYY